LIPGKGDYSLPMIKVEEALTIILDSVKVLDSRKVSLRASLDRVLAEDIYADSHIPPFDNSSMDGYAIRKGALPPLPGGFR